jgi:hypothetical protein
MTDLTGFHSRPSYCPRAVYRTRRIVGADVGVGAGALVGVPPPCVSPVSWRTMGKRRVGASTPLAITPLKVRPRGTRLEAFRAICMNDDLLREWGLLMRTSMGCGQCRFGSKAAPSSSRVAIEWAWAYLFEPFAVGRQPSSRWRAFRLTTVEAPARLLPTVRRQTGGNAVEHHVREVGTSPPLSHQ